ncbi:MAG: acyl-CoA thioesterase II [Acidimicrobiia bacterium]
MSAVLPTVFDVEDLGDGHFVAPHPTDDPESRDVVFSGQLLGQMIMVSDAAVQSSKEVKSIHAIFARAGTYSGGAMDYQREPMHAGRAWGSDTITVTQGDRLLSRGLVLLNTVEPDLIRHGPNMPDVAPPDVLSAGDALVFPGVEARMVDDPDAIGSDGSPAMYFWMRSEKSYDSIAANQAILSWCQPGFIIGLAMRPHADAVNIGDAHRTISTGVISHTCHFHEHFDVGDWLLVAQEASYAGRGRVFGSGSVFTRDGTLVSTFAQDSMVRGVEGTLDPKRAM